METVSIDELLLGVEKDIENRQIWAQLLANKFADSVDTQSIDSSIVIKALPIITEALLKEKDNSTKNTLLIALSNCSVSDSNSEDICKFLIKNDTIREQFNRLIELFTAHNPQAEVVTSTDSDEDYWLNCDPLQHLASVLCNLCQNTTGRDYAVKYYLKDIIPQIRSRNPVRQRGVAGSLKSCLFDSDIHWWIVSEVKAVTSILIPLVVGIAFTDREKEGMDPVVWLHAEKLVSEKEEKSACPIDTMKLLLECIVLLCQRRVIREELRKLKVYPVIKNLHTTLEDDAVSEIIYQIVDFLMGEEEPSAPLIS